jgi:hypothetical protein
MRRLNMNVWFRGAWLATLVGAPAVARAQAASGPLAAPPEVQQRAPAQQYARGSVGLLSQNDYLLGIPRGNLRADASDYFFDVGLAASVRVVIRHFLIEPHFGFGVSRRTLTGVDAGRAYYLVQFNPGIGLGGVIVLGPQVTLSPMARASFSIAPPPANVAVLVTSFMAFTAELPATFFLGRNGFIEPYLGLGLGLTMPNLAGPTATLVVNAGYRLGVVF